jgi:plasmid stabilization system protein ParE
LAPLSTVSDDIRIALYERHRILYRIVPNGIEIGLIPHQSSDLMPQLERYASLLARKRR